jgi:Major Facilitator Superfamily
MKKVLQLPGFRRLLAVTILNELAVSISVVALALLVYRRTGSAFGATAFFLCAEVGPAFVSPLVVSRVDQRSVRAVLGLIYGFEALIFLILATLVYRLSVAPLLLLALLDGSLAVAARVLGRSAWTAETSPVGLLREAAAVTNTSLAVCYMVGPALGGALVAAGGTRAALFVDVGVFVLMTVTITTAHGLPKAVAERAPSAGRLRSALRRARAEPLIRRLLALQAAAMLFFTISLPVEVVFAQHTLKAGAGGYGALLAGWGAGAIVGSGFYARWRGRPSRLLITVGTLLLGAGFLLMAVAPTLGVAIAAAVIAGVGNGVQVVAMRTALQEAVPEQLMALILSLNESIFQAVPGAGILLGGALAALAGPRQALAVAAVGSFLVACLMWLRLRDAPQIAVAASDPVHAPDPAAQLTAPVRQL